jgi:hypothetical protein
MVKNEQEMAILQVEKKRRGQYFVTVSRKSAMEGEGESGRR